MFGDLILYTSGSTAGPRQIHHRAESVNKFINMAAKAQGLTSQDRVLNMLPSHVIGYYTVTAGPAMAVGATLCTSEWDPYRWLKLFQEFKPTVTVIIPRHYEILSKLKGWEDLDMSCLRYLVMGAGTVKQEYIDDILSKGVQQVATWYGLTEFPPPVIAGINTDCFDLTRSYGDYSVEFSDEGEIIIDGYLTGDLFDTTTGRFLRRKKEVIGVPNWKTDPK